LFNVSWFGLFKLFFSRVVNSYNYFSLRVCLWCICVGVSDTSPNGHDSAARTPDGTEMFSVDGANGAGNKYGL